VVGIGVGRGEVGRPAAGVSDGSSSVGAGVVAEDGVESAAIRVGRALGEETTVSAGSELQAADASKRPIEANSRKKR
jgi:hypothetical protein